MANYIGNEPLLGTSNRDRFAGDGSTVTFALSQVPAQANGILVMVSGVVQDSLTYGCVGKNLVFTEAPPYPVLPALTNIEVVFLGRKGAPYTANWNIPIADNSGSADTIAASFNPAIGSLGDNLVVEVVLASPNATTTPTFNASGLGAVDVVNYDGTPIAAGQLFGTIKLRYDTGLVKWVVVDSYKVDTNRFGPFTAGRNLLINGNFNINQRVYVSGVATVGVNQYTLDRWRIPTTGQNLTFTTSGNGNLVTAPASGIEQVIEGMNIGSATAVINWIGTATCTVDGVAKVKGELVTLVPGTNCSVKFFGGTVSQAQLELGNRSTPFEFRSYPSELIMCQRYFEKLSGNITGSWASSASSFAYWAFKVTKRVTPTIVLGGTSDGTVSNNTVDFITLTKLSANYAVIGTDTTATAEL